MGQYIKVSGIKVNNMVEVFSQINQAEKNKIIGKMV
jgi:hypothetical protein